MKKSFQKAKFIFLISITIIVIVLGSYLLSHPKIAKQETSIDSTRNVDKLLRQKKPVSILLLGTDTGELGRTYRGRTDTMIIATVNPKTQTTTLTSLPRDLQVTIPEFEDQSPAKINAAYSWGGYKTAIQTVKKTLDIPVDFYLLVNMRGLKQTVDAVGGVSVKPLRSFKYEGHTFVKDKPTTMDGTEALAYSRMRYDDPLGDYGRQARQRQLLLAIAHKTNLTTLINIKFIKSLSQHTQTNLSTHDLLFLSQSYRQATQHILSDHLQGQSTMENGQAFEIGSHNEINRVHRQIMKNLR